MDRAFPYVENSDNGSWWNTYDKNDAQIGFHRDNETLIQLGGQYSGRLITTDAVSFTVSEVDGGNAWELLAVIEFAGLDPDLDAFEGREMGLDVVVGDADVVGEERNGRAGWYGRADNPWQHPRQWGKLVLGTGMQNDNTDILAFSIADQRMDAEIDTADHEISVEFPLGTDVTALMPEIVVHETSSVSPASGVATDFTNPQTYTVTAQDASTQDWTVTVTFGPAPDTAMYEEAFADADSNFVTYTTSGEMDDDFEAYYKVSYDDTALHVFVHVEDPDLVNSNEGFDQNDYIDIFVDMDRAFPYVENQDNGSWWNTYDENDAQIGFHRDNDTLIQVGGQYSGRIVTADAVSFTVSEVDGGNAWELEASILFEGMDPDLDIYDMRTLGLEVVVGDADVVGEDRNGRAAWFGPADNAWQHPRQWGSLVLEGGPENDNTDILAFSIEGQRVNAVINGTDHEIGVDLPYGTDVTALEPAIEVHEASTVSPANGAAADFTNPVTYTVTAQDGSTQDWTASVTLGLEPDTSTYEDTFANADSNFVTYTTSGEMDDDFEAYYKTFWADTALHVFVHVEDPDLVNSNEGFDQNDYIDIFLDMDSAFPYVENSDNGSWWNTYDKNDAQIGFHRDNDTLIQLGGQYSGRIVTTDAVSFTVAEVDGGNAWELEAVISFAGMDPDEIVGNELELGFELVVGDADTVGAERNGRAAWYGPADNAWQHPRQWGTLVLEGQAASSDALIHKAMLDEMNSDTAVVIDAAKDTVIITVEFGTDVTALEPMLKLHPAASVDLTGPQDFTNPVAYTVTAEDASTRVWDIAVDIETANSANLITAFSVPDQRSSTIDDDAGTVESVVEFMADVSALEATVEVSPDASVTPASGLVRDFTVPVVYTVIAEDESTKDYVVTMKRAPGLIDSKIGTFNSEAGRIEEIWTDSTTVTELLDSLVLSDNAESTAVLLIADSTAVAGTEILTSAMFLRISGGGLDTDYGLVVTDAPAPPIPVTGFVENFDDPATVDMTMWDVNPRKHNDDPSGDPVFVVTHDVAEGALKIVMDQFEFPDGLMFNLSKYIIDLTNNPLAQMTIKIQDATYAGVTTLSIPVQLSAFSFWGEGGRRLGGENVPVTLDDNGSIDFTTLYYDFRVGGSWATDSAGIDSTQYILFETVSWPSPHTATIWIDEIRLGDSAAPYVPSSEAEILATMYGTVVDANKVVEGVSDSLTVTEFLIGLTISDLASVLMLEGPGGDTITRPERTDIADTQVIQVTAEDGTIQEYTITVWPVSVGNLIAPDVTIYPNPASDILYIRNLDGFDRLSVTNIVGKHVRMINIETKQLDINISNLENGLYFLNLYSSKYGTVSTKFIKR